jgi:hypothetical protein
MNLTNTSVNIKKGFKIFLVVVFLYYLIFHLLFPRARLIVARFLPERTPPNVLYGQLPKLNFESRRVFNTQIEFELNTRGGLLPVNFPKKMVVYKFQEPKFSYLAGKNAEEHAAVLGFNDNDLISNLKSDLFEWRDLITTSRLTIDLNTNKLNVTTQMDKIADQLYDNKVDKNRLDQNVATLFEKIGRFDDSYKIGSKKITYGRVLGSKILEATDKEPSNVVRVDIFRNIGKYPILSDDPREGNLNIIVGKNSRQPDPLNNPIVNAYYWEIDPDDSATYPISFISDVWNEVRNGNGVLSGVYLKNKNPFEPYEQVHIERILINDIYLAYLDTKENQTFLQPIYVFEGNFSARGSKGGDVVIYYPAIQPEFIN